jgi:hypothetical protein
VTATVGPLADAVEPWEMTMHTLKVTLSDGVSVEDVGGEAVVYTHANASVVRLSSSAGSLLLRAKQEGVVATALTPEVSILVDQGLLTVVSGLTRRGVVTGGVVAVGAAVVSLALPQAAAASSRPVPEAAMPPSGLWTVTSSAGPDAAEDEDLFIAFLALGNFVGDNATGPTNLTSGDGLSALTERWESGKGALWADPLDFPLPDDFRDDIVAGFLWSTEYEVTFIHAERSDWWEALEDADFEFPPPPPP